MKRIVARVALILVLSCNSAVAHMQAAPSKPVELSADSIAYDSVKGIMIAEGSVIIVQEDAVMTGSRGEYNNKTKEAHISGGAKVVKDHTTLVAAELRSYEHTHMVATGDPVLTKDDNILMGPQIDYYSDKEYAIVKGWAKLTMPDGVMTANQIETFNHENRAVADGNVHIVSQTRNLDATSDHAVYYGAKEEAGKTVLTGNARAVQDGNVLTGSTMTLYLDNKTIDVQGRSKLVIIPQ